MDNTFSWTYPIYLSWLLISPLKFLTYNLDSNLSRQGFGENDSNYATTNIYYENKILRLKEDHDKRQEINNISYKHHIRKFESPKLICAKFWISD